MVNTNGIGKENHQFYGKFTILHDYARTWQVDNNHLVDFTSKMTIQIERNMRSNDRFFQTISDVFKLNH